LKKILISIVALLLLTSCQVNQNNCDRGSSIIPGLPSGTQSSSESIANISESTDTSTQKTDPQSAPDPASKEADWTLDVNDTVNIDIEGIKIAYTLTLKAVKPGGKTDLGSYTGTAALKMKMDASGLSKEMVSVMGGAETELQAQNVTIEIGKYDREKYDDFGLSDGEAPLSLMSEADGMALGSFTMEGSGGLDIQSIAPHTYDARKTSDTGAGELAYKINVEGGQVSVSIPLLNISESFKGMITGIPRN
jgi:hypothetical protein